MHTTDVAQKYFDLSNQAELATIADLIHPQATYSSDNTGLYYGRKSIMQMMQQFFALHQSLHWHIDSLKQLSDHIVEIEFTCKYITADDQGSRQGIERIVAVDGQIRHIEVQAINS
ncbi:nuclear transport factor 2 family protein [Marinicella sp. W31]|uniref:nuclear transport factor 2 family protein n=1 Tax=Marinicella sp. W31 TaxID=3023713 RepID=UPI0037565903